MSPHRVTLVTAGNPARVTGGHRYNARILTALRAAGYYVDTLALPAVDARAGASQLLTYLSTTRLDLLIIDSIALPAAALAIPSLVRATPLRTLALMHMRPPDPRHARALLPIVDWTVAVSPHLASELARFGADPDRISVISPGKDGVVSIYPHPVRDAEVHEHENQNSMHSLRDLDGTGPAHSDCRGVVNYLCVANWSPGKGIHVLVDALARTDDTIHLHLVGEEGEGAYARGVRRRIARRDLTGRVTCHGVLTGPALAERYVSADAFILPSESEGYGTAYAEAMTAGLPVIASRIGSIPWLVGDDAGVLVSPRDVSALAEAMETLARDARLREAMGTAARRRAAHLPCWRETEARFCALVSRLLGNQHEERAYFAEGSS